MEPVEFIEAIYIFIAIGQYVAIKCFFVVVYYTKPVLYDVCVLLYSSKNY